MYKNTWLWSDYGKNRIKYKITAEIFLFFCEYLRQWIKHPRIDRFAYWVLVIRLIVDDVMADFMRLAGLRNYMIMRRIACANCEKHIQLEHDKKLHSMLKTAKPMVQTYNVSCALYKKYGDIVGVAPQLVLPQVTNNKSFHRVVPRARKRKKRWKIRHSDHDIRCLWPSSAMKLCTPRK